MEAAGLVIGVLGLASLCSSCLEGFDLISSAKSFSIDYEILCIKMDIERTRLLQWTEGVGLLAQNERDRNASILSKTVQPQLERILEAIKLLLTNSDDLVSYYGLAIDDSNSVELSTMNRSYVSSNRAQAFRTAFVQFQDRISRQQTKVSVGPKIRWAIKDRKKFSSLLDVVHELVNGLYELVVIPRQFERLMVREDVDSLKNDTAEFRLLQIASEGQPDAWSECADARMTASQQSSQEIRNIDEWLEDISVQQQAVDEQPEELARQDPLGIQIWKHYTNTKNNLPNQQRLENLTWRMMAMKLNSKS